MRQPKTIWNDNKQWNRFTERLAKTRCPKCGRPLGPVVYKRGIAHLSLEPAGKGLGHKVCPK